MPQPYRQQPAPDDGHRGLFASGLSGHPCAMEIGFYHVTRGPLEAVLARLLEKALAGGARVLVRARDAAEAERLDRALWMYDAASFLPHGRAGEPQAAEQPVLIAEDATEPANAARVAVLLAPPVAGLTGYDRAAYLFPDSETETARAEWRAVKAAGGVAAYWKQSARGWGKAG